MYTSEDTGPFPTNRQFDKEAVPVASNSREETISLLDLMIVLVKHRRFIIFTTIIGMIGIVAFSIYTLRMPPDSPFNPLPNVYAPKVEVLLQDSSGGGLGSSLSGEMSLLAGLAGMSLGSASSSADLAQWILKGNTIVDQVAEEFGVFEKYADEKFPKTAARTALLEALETKFDMATGILSITFEDIDPVFATEVLNRFLELLEARFKTLTVEKVSVKREFLEDRLAQTEIDLKKAQNEIIEFQKKYGIIDISVQAQHILTQEASIRSSILQKELEVQNLRQYLRADDPQIVRLQNEIKVSQRLLDEIRGGFEQFSAENIAQNQLPEISATYLNLRRDLLIQEKMYELLRQQYETTKIDEADNSRKFQIVERAEVPEVKAGPSRGRISIIFSISVFMLAVMFAFVKEYFARAKADPDESRKLEYITSSLSRKKRTR